MAFRVGAKQSFPAAAVGNTTTVIGFINSCQGARGLLIRVRNASQADVMTLGAAGSFDGVNPCAGYAMTVSGSGIGNGLGGLGAVASATAVAATPIPEIMVPFVRITAQNATNAGTADFDIWPFFDVSDPSIPVGQNLTV